MRWFAALVFALLLSSTAGARADDFGPPKDVSAVKYDAARLLAYRVKQLGADPQRLVISDVVVTGPWAILSWSVAGEHGIAGFHRQRDQWWDVLEGERAYSVWIFNTAPPVVANYFTPYSAVSADLLLDFNLPTPLVAEAKIHNADVHASSAKATVGSADPGPNCDWDFCLPLSNHGGNVQTVSRAASAGYRLNIAFSANTSTPQTKIKRVFVRMPTDGESTQTLHGDAFVFFTVELAGPKPITFKPGTTVDVWFPHVLDAYRHYGLTAAMANAAFGPVRGTLADNTLHFVLPAFTVAPGDPVMFEIDGDP